jgi:hypothetical protein
MRLSPSDPIVGQGLGGTGASTPLTRLTLVCRARAQSLFATSVLVNAAAGWQCDPLAGQTVRYFLRTYVNDLLTDWQVIMLDHLEIPHENTDELFKRVWRVAARA